MPPDPRRPAGTPCRCCARTPPSGRRTPFAPDGERSIARAYIKAFGRARRLVYVEDQYLWSGAAAGVLADGCGRSPACTSSRSCPAIPDRDGRLSGPPYRIGQQQAHRAAARRPAANGCAVFDLEAPSGWPIYVHSKVCVIDDTWMIVGSDNLNIRSWTNDSELSCAVIDERARRARAASIPVAAATAPACLARQTRGCGCGASTSGGRAGDDADLVDGVPAIACCAPPPDSTRGTSGGRTGPRPPGRLRHHRPGRCAGGRRGGPSRCTACSSIPTAVPAGCGAPAGVLSRADPSWGRAELGGNRVPGRSEDARGLQVADRACGPSSHASRSCGGASSAA